MNDLLGGQVDFMCDQTANTLSHIKADKIKVFGVTSKDRIAQLPDTPTLNEAGLPGFGPPQDCRRLQLLRDWSHDEEGIDEIRT
jgi:tripartite-type tricarboxylate transporter receptor subunit TctC